MKQHRNPRLHGLLPVHVWALGFSSFSGNTAQSCPLFCPTVHWHARVQHLTLTQESKKSKMRSSWGYCDFPPHHNPSHHFVLGVGWQGKSKRHNSLVVHNSGKILSSLPRVSSDSEAKPGLVDLLALLFTLYLKPYTDFGYALGLIHSSSRDHLHMNKLDSRKPPCGVCIEDHIPGPLLNIESLLSCGYRAPCTTAQETTQNSSYDN